jgi:hypothetical protein
MSDNKRQAILLSFAALLILAPLSVFADEPRIILIEEMTATW